MATRIRSTASAYASSGSGHWLIGRASRLTGPGALDRAHHLLLVAEVGGQEVGTDQQQDDVGRLELAIDLAPPLAPRLDVVVEPLGDQAVPPQHRHVLAQLPEHVHVGMAVRVEDPQGHDAMLTGLRREIASRTIRATHESAGGAR
jgi:hypothetical protein